MKKAALLTLGIVLIVVFSWRAYQRNSSPKFIHVSGLTMGAIAYNVKYFGSTADLKGEIDQVLVALNQSLSTYIPDSEISRLNSQGQLDFESPYFLPVLETSQRIFSKTGGAFDPSIGPLVQAWGFGPKKSASSLDTEAIDSLRLIIGFSKVQFDAQTITVPTNFQLDFSAIAKGYAVDLVAELLEKNGIANYMVEIGGEVRCKGVNEKGKTWTLGIEDPTVQKHERRLFAVTRLKNRALATSGNYRNYYKKDGRIYAHIIDPRTGYNAMHNLLSVSVFAPDCMTSDAYATAFMVLGIEKSYTIAEDDNELDALFIYQNEAGELAVLVTDGIKPFVEIQ